MNRLQRALPLGLAAALLAAAPHTACAASPEFARTAEEWASLRDNVLEYGELAGLIHEYNATVQKNAIDYNEFRKEYGDTNDEVANRYRELASDMRDAIGYPDVEDSSYGMTMAQIINNERMADTYMKQADDALEDSYVKHLSYSQTEANLVSQAQSEMINYYLNQIKLETAKKNRQLSERSLQSTQTKQGLGMATEMAVLNAQESLRNADQAIISAEAALEKGRQTLLVLCGWQPGDMPQIGAIPEVDMEYLASINPETDKEQALANNYTLLSNKRQLENARSQDKRDSLQTTIAENERKIAASLHSSYQGVISAKISYDLAVTEAALADQSLATAQLQYSIGQMGATAYETQLTQTETAKLGVETARLNLFQALESYRWAVNGLAGA